MEPILTAAQAQALRADIYDNAPSVVRARELFDLAQIVAMALPDPEAERQVGLLIDKAVRAVREAQVELWWRWRA